jgi:hypothetical protein
VFARNVASVVRMMQPFLRPFGAKLVASTMYRIPDDCENCVDYYIVLRLVCDEKPETCKILREQIKKELESQY